LVYVFSGNGINMREDEIKYNAAVHDWNQGRRQEFSIGFNLSRDGSTISMIADADSPDAIEGNDGVSLDSYAPLKYYVPLGSIIPAQPWASGTNVTVTISPAAEGTKTAIREEIPVMRATIYTQSTLNCTFTTCFTICKDKGGDLGSNHPTMLYLPSTLWVLH